VVPMPTAVTQMGASYVHAGLVLKAMVSPVQVKQLCRYPSKCISCMYVIATLYYPTDVSECVRSLDECDPNATCNNTFGSYDCICNLGFTGNGFICSGIHIHSSLDFAGMTALDLHFKYVDHAGCVLRMFTY